MNLHELRKAFDDEDHPIIIGDGDDAERFGYFAMLVTNEGLEADLLYGMARAAQDCGMGELSNKFLRLADELSEQTEKQRSEHSME